MPERNRVPRGVYPRKPKPEKPKPKPEKPKLTIVLLDVTPPSWFKNSAADIRQLHNLVTVGLEAAYYTVGKIEVVVGEYATYEAYLAAQEGK
jgi:hypothetical protein